MWSAEYQACWVLRSPCQEPKRESVSIGLIRPAGSHVTAADHLGIVAMDRNGGMVSTAKMCAVARMVDIAVGQDDEAEIVRPATCCSTHATPHALARRHCGMRRGTSRLSA